MAQCAFTTTSVQGCHPRYLTRGQKLASYNGLISPSIRLSDCDLKFSPSMRLAQEAGDASNLECYEVYKLGALGL